MSDADRTPPSRELERAWLLRAMPDMEALRRDGYDVTPIEIEQGYVVDDAAMIERAGLRGRVRRMAWAGGREEFTHTIKSGLGRVREEVERSIDRATFERAWECTEGGRLRKVRWLVRGQGAADQLWEVDLFLDFPLVIAEAEMADGSAPGAEAALAAMTLPPWLLPLVVREVSDDSRYRNSSLARFGPPR